jgi:hypothetical protein
MDSIIRQPLAPTAPTAPTEPTAFNAPIASTVLTAPTASTTPVASTVLTAPTASTAPRQLSPDRPEVLMKAYLAEKTAWLAQHPTVQPIEYRKARKWKNLRAKVLKE